jgi:hypothetical protein
MNRDIMIAGSIGAIRLQALSSRLRYRPGPRIIATSARATAEGAERMLAGLAGTRR